MAVGLGAAPLLAPPTGGAADGMAPPLFVALGVIGGAVLIGACDVFDDDAFDIVEFELALSLPQPTERAAAASKVIRAGTLRIEISWP